MCGIYVYVYTCIPVYQNIYNMYTAANPPPRPVHYLFTIVCTTEITKVAENKKNMLNNEIPFFYFFSLVDSKETSVSHISFIICQLSSYLNILIWQNLLTL